MKQAAFTTSRVCALFAALAMTATANAAYNVPTTISNGPMSDFLLLPNGNTVYTGWATPTSTERNVYIYDHIAKTSQAIAATALDELVDSPAGSNARNDFLYISGTDLYLHDGISNSNVLMNTAPIQGWWRRLSANGGVIWMQADPGSTSSDIWYKSSSTSAAINISNSPYDDYGMSFYSDGADSYILYFRNMGGTLNVMRYNIATQVTTNMTTDYHVADNWGANSKGDIVWLSGAGTSLSIYTAATGFVATIPAPAGTSFLGPRINSFGDVAWTTLTPIDANSNAALLYRMETGGVPTLIAGWTGGSVNNTNGGYDYLANGDLLYNGPGAAGSGSDIFVYSRAAGTTENISNQSPPAGIPESSANANGDVAWTDGADIFVYTKATGVVDRLTNGSIQDLHAQINNDGQVVWVSWTNPDTQPTLALYSATPALPDLAIGSGTATSTVPTGGTVSGNYSLSNSGTGAAAASAMGLVLSTNTTVGDADDTLMASVAIPQLAAGSSQVGSYSFAMNKPVGTYYLYAVADYSNVVTESNESDNNLLLATITVTSPTGSDLVVTAVTHAATSVARGKRFTVSSTVKNQGTSKTTTKSQIDAGVYLSTDAVCATSDYRIGSWKISSARATLAAGASVSKNGASYTVPSSGVPAGTYYVCVFADYSLKEAESNETNNGRVSSYNAGKIVVK